MSLASDRIDMFDDVSNPLDGVEEILCANDWTFDRANEDELSVQVTGKMGEYRLFFEWQEEFSAMRLCCQYDMDIKSEAADTAAKLMTVINTGLWLGHFTFYEGTDIPCFRHTALFRGMTHCSGTEHIQDMVDIALAECERYFPVFDILSRGEPHGGLNMELALMQTVGES